jgi:LysM repeat protein
MYIVLFLLKRFEIALLLWLICMQTLRREQYYMKSVHRRKNKVMTFLFLILTIISIFAIGFRIFEVSAAEKELKTAETVEYLVQKGDTLWGIAEKTGFNVDIREIVYRIKVLNNLDSSTIYPGDVLLIPKK